MKRVFLMAVLAAAGMSQVAHAENSPWMFNRSYYSHEPVQNVRIGRAPPAAPITPALAARMSIRAGAGTAARSTSAARCTTTSI